MLPLQLTWAVITLISRNGPTQVKRSCPSDRLKPLLYFSRCTIQILVLFFAFFFFFLVYRASGLWSFPGPRKEAFLFFPSSLACVPSQNRDSTALSQCLPLYSNRSIFIHNLHLINLTRTHFSAFFPCHAKKKLGKKQTKKVEWYEAGKMSPCMWHLPRVPSSLSLSLPLSHPPHPITSYSSALHLSNRNFCTFTSYNIPTSSLSWLKHVLWITEWLLTQPVSGSESLTSALFTWLEDFPFCKTIFAGKHGWHSSPNL